MTRYRTTIAFSCALFCTACTLADDTADTVADVFALVRWLGGSSPGIGSSTASAKEPLDILK